MNRAIRIGVIGSGSCSDQTARFAEEVGRRIAEAGAILICGGGGGVMEAASRGAARRGGTVVGILPSDDARTANPFVLIPIVTGMGNARNAINALTSEALIAVAGGPGTLSEIGLALKVGTPVVGLETWELSIDGESPDDVYRAENPAEAVEKAIELARTRVLD
jgi:uncharacterized protein (TIGR00725 family)